MATDFADGGPCEETRGFDTSSVQERPEERVTWSQMSDHGSVWDETTYCGIVVSQ